MTRHALESLEESIVNWKHELGMIESPTLGTASPVPAIIYRDDANAFIIQVICQRIVQIPHAIVSRLADDNCSWIFGQELLNENIGTIGRGDVMFFWIRC